VGAFCFRCHDRRFSREISNRFFRWWGTFRTRNRCLHFGLKVKLCIVIIFNRCPNSFLFGLRRRRIFLYFLFKKLLFFGGHYSYNYNYGWTCLDSVLSENENTTLSGRQSGFFSWNRNQNGHRTKSLFFIDTRSRFES
jgi:hypothetical protein